MASLLPNAGLCWQDRLFLAISGLYGAVAVGLSAYRAHGLKKSLETAGIAAEEVSQRVANLATAVDLTLLHTVALVAVIALAAGRLKYAVCLTFSAGILLFGGSLTFQSVWGIASPAFVPPAGGMLLIAGWLGLLPLSCCSAGAKNRATC